jgi:hypothetical protein
MPKNQVADPITDQEMAFARQVLSGTMTDRQAAEAVGLNPDTAAYTKAKPRVRAYMLEHRAAVQQQLVEQEIDEQRRLKQSRERVLDRLWEIASLDPEMTRGSITGQVKAIQMIIAIEGLIPDRRAASAQNKPAHPPVTGQIHQAARLREQQENTDYPPAPSQQEASPEPQPAPGSVDGPPPASDPVSNPNLDSTASTFSAGQSSLLQAASLALRVPGADFVPDTRVPFSPRKNQLAWRR